METREQRDLQLASELDREKTSTGQTWQILWHGDSLRSSRDLAE